MAKGPKPKPTKLKLVQGNPGKRPISENEPKPEVVNSPKAPRWLGGIAAAEWRRMVPLLEKLGLLTTIDLQMFASYCSAWGVYRENYAFIRKNGYTFIVIDKEGNELTKRYPQVKIAEEYLRICKTLGENFGLTPSARTRIQVGSEEMADAETFFFGVNK